MARLGGASALISCHLYDTNSQSDRLLLINGRVAAFAHPLHNPYIISPQRHAAPSACLPTYRDPPARLIPAAAAAEATKATRRGPTTPPSGVALPAGNRNASASRVRQIQPRRSRRLTRSRPPPKSRSSGPPFYFRMTRARTELLLSIAARRRGFAKRKKKTKFFKRHFFS